MDKKIIPRRRFRGGRSAYHASHSGGNHRIPEFINVFMIKLPDAFPLLQSAQ
jgi:hypothetical protein